WPIKLLVDPAPLSIWFSEPIRKCARRHTKCSDELLIVIKARKIVGQQADYFRSNAFVAPSQCEQPANLEMPLVNENAFHRVRLMILRFSIVQDMALMWLSTSSDLKTP